MSNSFSLDNLREALDQEYAPLKIEVGGEELVLQNLMRIDSKPRKAVMDALKSLEKAEGKEDEEQTPEEVLAMSEALAVVLENVTAGGKGPKLVAALDGDLLLSMKVLEKWTAATQAPEAPTSPAS